MGDHTIDRTCVALAGRAADPRVGDAMRTLAAHLLGRGIHVNVADPALALSGPGVHPVAEQQLAAAATLVVAVGGDGTMLHAARMAAVADVPLLGINRGRLGFLADVGPGQMLQSVDDALAGRCHAERRMLLAAELQAADGQVTRALALNDVVVSKGETGRMVDLRTWVNGVYVNTHAGDGFIVATPTGSTAYALSCSGPIVHPSLDAVVLVPVCPHTLSDRPIVVPAGNVIELELADRFESRAQVVCDGIVLSELGPGVRLRIERAPVSATLLHPPGHDYYRILRSKLNWGRGARAEQSAGD